MNVHVRRFAMKHELVQKAIDALPEEDDPSQPVKKLSQNGDQTVSEKDEQQEEEAKSEEYQGIKMQINKNEKLMDNPSKAGSSDMSLSKTEGPPGKHQKVVNNL